ncbi:hypothetical protein ACHAWU_006383 [Discostella pseudostelligera]|uniref:Golgin-84 n=1 Tax=Discostella pseudostelligera TaxID=259834 RepID=A0ABD3N3X1_9STRA
MSRWLRNVNALLETLDNQVEETVEEHRYNRSVAVAVSDAAAASGATAAGGSSEGSSSASATVAAEDWRRQQLEARDVENILAKRGLLNDDAGGVEDDIDDDGNEDVVEFGDNSGEGVATENVIPVVEGSGGDKGNAFTEIGVEERIAMNVMENKIFPSDQEIVAGGVATLDEAVVISTGGGGGALTGEQGRASDNTSTINDECITNNDGDRGYELQQNNSDGDVADGISSSSTTAAAAGNNGDAPTTNTTEGEQSQNVHDDGLLQVDNTGDNAATSNAMLVYPKQAPSTTPSPSSSNLTTPRDTPNSVNNASSSSLSNAASAQQLKELRKLRRHVLQLNSDLESAEREIDAQRQELDRAAARMERDRSRHKQEREAADTSHAADVAALTSSHERTIRQMKEMNEVAMREMEARILRAEQQRAKEGGERDADLADALERERAALAAAARVQEERNTMDERITSLTTEITRLETRLEHATSAMDLASERERNAEEQLDKALSLHAKQLGVRQRREAELEQTVADLAAALVVAKTKVEAAMNAGIARDEAGGGLETSNVGTGGESQADLQAMLQDAQDEIETLRAQLGLERRRCSTLHTELQDLSKEQADELSSAHAKQRQYERKISDLTTVVAKLQSSLRRATPGGDNDDALLLQIDDDGSTGASSLQYSGDEKKETDHLRKQITSLSEKVFEQQTKIDLTKGEISTLKNRLRSAAMRADAAEKSLEVANQRLVTMDVGISSADEELGLEMRVAAAKKRRPVGGSSSKVARHGFRQTSKVESIRSALGLQPGRFSPGGWQEMIASLLDTFDTLSVDLGSHFRVYPMSRLAFMIYLLILHSWAFFLLVYHAHAQGTGSDGDIHYGPEAMFRSYRHMEQVGKVVSSVANTTLEQAANVTNP